jgi:hypothetical protein
MLTAKRLNTRFAPTYGSIKGTIQIHRKQYGDEDVLSLGCIKVVLLDADDGQWVDEEYTDDSGNFAFLGLALKAYMVVFPELIDYRKQKFLPEGSGFRHKFPARPSREQRLVDGVDIHYGLAKSGSTEGNLVSGDTQPILAVNA